MKDLNNLPNSLSYYELNDSFRALKKQSCEMRTKGHKEDNEFMIAFADNLDEVAGKINNIMKFLEGKSDLKMVVVDPYEKKVFDYAFRDTLGIKE